MRRTAFKIKNGDIAIENNNIQIVEGPKEIEQSIKERLELAQGEWFLNIEWGLNQEPFKTKRYQLDLIRASVIEAIKQDPRIDVVDIKEIEINSRRQLELKADVTTKEYGIIDIEI